MTRGAPSNADAVPEPEDGLRLTRRELLLAALAAGLLPSRPQAARAAGAAAEPLLAALASREAAAALGRAYLEAHSDEADPVRLGELLRQALRTSGSGGAALRDRIDSLLRTDYIRGDMVQVDGWLLSLNEARLYALAAVAQPG